MNEKELKAKIAEYKAALDKFKAGKDNPQLSDDMKKMIDGKITMIEGKVKEFESKLEEAVGEKPKDKPKGEDKPKATPKPKDKPKATPKPKAPKYLTPADINAGDKISFQVASNSKREEATVQEDEDYGKFIEKEGARFRLAVLMDMLMVKRASLKPKTTKSKKSKAKGKKTTTKKGKLPRHVFEHDMEKDGKKGIFRYIIQAVDKAAAEAKNSKAGKWVKSVTKGRSPLVGFIEHVEKKDIGRPKTRVIKHNYLFEKETDTTVTRKIVKATSEAKAKEVAPDGFEYKRQLKGSGRLPKEGTFKKVVNRKGKKVLKPTETEPKKDKSKEKPKSTAAKLKSDEIRIGGKVYKKGTKEACDALLKSYDERRKNASAASKSRQAQNNKSRNVRKAANVGSVLKKLIKIEFSTSKKNAENYEKLIKGLTDNKADIIAKGKAFIKALSILSDYNADIAEKEVTKAINEMIAELKEKLAAKKKQSPATKKAKMKQGGEAGITYHVVGGDEADHIDYDADSLQDALDFYDSLAPAERYSSMIYGLNRKGYPVVTYKGEGMYEFGGEA